jgi:hypothetical protein
VPLEFIEGKPRLPAARDQETTASSSGCLTGNGCISTARATARTAVFTPIPSVSDRMATRVKPGDFASRRPL